MSDVASQLEPRLLRSFIAVAEELHFARAARRLHLSQPPLSMQIKKLEELLGAQLFERDRRHVELTESGAFLLHRARHLLSEAARTCRDVRLIGDGEAGVLTVGYTTTATYEVLPKLVAAYSRQHPNVQLELVELQSGAMPEALRSRRIEVGIGCGPLAPADLDELVLVRERVLVAVGVKHPLARRKRLGWRELDGQAFILVRPDIEPAWAGACAEALRRERVAYTVAQQTDSKLAMLGLVAAGLGVSLVSQSMQRLRRVGVRYLPLAAGSLRLPLAAVVARTLTPCSGVRRARAADYSCGGVDGVGTS